MRLGLLGGTFDPFHNGHLAAAEAAIGCARLDSVIFMPAAQPPHRPPAIASAAQRFEMCRLATEGVARFAVSDVEMKRGGPSYTVDTLRELSELHRGAELFLILGWDAARLFPSWREPDEVRKLASIVVVARPGSEAPRVADLKPAGLDGENVVLCLRATPDISASDIRRAIAAGEPITGRAPVAVEQYISAHHLYAG